MKQLTFMLAIITFLYLIGRHHMKQERMETHEAERALAIEQHHAVSVTP